jgi:hypothetical protein
VRSSGTSAADVTGSRAIEQATVRIGEVPGGRYRLRLDPHSAIVDPNGTFEVVVKRQLAANGKPLAIVILSWIGPIVMSIVAAFVEGARWQKSDYG